MYRAPEVYPKESQLWQAPLSSSVLPWISKPIHNSTLKGLAQIPLLLLQTAKDNYHSSSGDQNVINPHFFTTQLKGQFLTINSAWGADSDLLIKVENRPPATVHLKL